MRATILHARDQACGIKASAADQSAVSSARVSIHEHEITSRRLVATGASSDVYKGNFRSTPVAIKVMRGTVGANRRVLD